jgi:hypothetical protein
MKTRIFLSAVVISLTVLSVQAMAHKNSNKASGRENMKEQALAIEDWMINEKVWTIDENAGSEKPLEIERWMIDGFEVASQVEMEENLALEDWMLNPSNWTMKNLDSEQEKTEEKLSVMPWMVLENKWIIAQK